MSMTCKDVEEKIYGYKREPGDTGKNLVADLLKELAESIGFNLDFLKEDGNKNKPFRFQDEDIEILRWIVEAAKSKQGKRLRCHDYEGAGGEFVDSILDAFVQLAVGNGVDSAEIYCQGIKVQAYTRNISVRDCIRAMTDCFEDDINTKFFLAPDRSANGIEDDHMDGVDRQVFLEFILSNIDEDIKDIRGIYWFFVQEKHGNEVRALRKSGDYLRQLTREQMEQFKKDILNRLEFDRALNEDEEYLESMERLSYLEDGQGKLQDQKKKKAVIVKTLDIMDRYAKEHLRPKDERVELPKISEDLLDAVGHYNQSYDELFRAIQQFRSMKAYRINNPVNDENETILEIGYRQRFGTPMFQAEGQP